MPVGIGLIFRQIRLGCMMLANFKAIRKLSLDGMRTVWDSGISTATVDLMLLRGLRFGPACGTGPMMLHPHTHSFEGSESTGER